MKHISMKETAALVRTSLKSSFPATKFSVRSKSYTGGARIDIEWTDGPTRDAVTAITDKFEGAGFDPYQDMKTYQTGTFNGEEVHFGVDYIFCSRQYSPELKIAAATQVVQEWGLSVTPREFVNAYETGTLWEMSQQIGLDGDTLRREFLANAGDTY